MKEKEYNYFFKEFEKLQKILSHKDDCDKYTLDECIEMRYNPWEWMLDWINFNKRIIKEFSDVNPQWTKNYYESDPNSTRYFPDIYMKFKQLIDSIDKEEYEIAAKLKKEISEY